jgi:hypothetical protein
VSLITKILLIYLPFSGQIFIRILLASLFLWRKANNPKYMSNIQQAGAAAPSTDPDVLDEQYRAQDKEDGEENNQAGESFTTSTEQQYMFIDNSAIGSSSSEAIRVHVMRESHRARRRLRGIERQSTLQQRMTIPSQEDAAARTNREDTTMERAGRVAEVTSGQTTDLGSAARATTLAEMNALADRRGFRPVSLCQKSSEIDQLNRC